MTSLFLNYFSNRSKSHQNDVYRIKFQHLRHVTPMRWKKSNHIRKIHVSNLLMTDVTISITYNVVFQYEL